MFIYTDNENRVSKSGKRHEIPDDHPLALMSETRRLCYIYDNGSFYPYIDTDEIKRLDIEAGNGWYYIKEYRQNKISELDSICTDTIYKGTDITLSTGETQHFTLDEQDQANLAGIGLQLGAGAEIISWHQDDVTKPCQFYTAEDAQKIINTLTVFKSYHITYFRDLRIYVNSLENIEDVEAIYYGYALPDKAKSDVLKYYEGLITNNKF